MATVVYSGLSGVNLLYDQPNTATYEINNLTNGQFLVVSGSTITTRAGGSQGAQGAQGPQGVQGPQGAQGTAGTSGAQGPQGPQGPQGVTGAQGPQGSTGSQGSQGGTGAQGPQGSGPQGPQGVQGPQGPQGPQGAQGTGAQGPQGPQGAGSFTSNPGSSLYSIGYTGSSSSVTALTLVPATTFTLNAINGPSSSTQASGIEFTGNWFSTYGASSTTTQLQILFENLTASTNTTVTAPSYATNSSIIGGGYGGVSIGFNGGTAYIIVWNEGFGTSPGWKSAVGSLTTALTAQVRVTITVQYSNTVTSCAGYGCHLALI